jgi:carboxypeptidase C (cathepsin A)
VKTPRTYVTSAGIYGRWDQRHQTPGYGKVPVANTAVDLAWALSQNPKMRLLVLQGFFDLATPYGATRYVLDHLEIPEARREAITLEFFEAGHMMYLHPESAAKFRRDLARFIDR